MENTLVNVSQIISFTIRDTLVKMISNREQNRLFIETTARTFFTIFETSTKKRNSKDPWHKSDVEHMGKGWEGIETQN